MKGARKYTTWTIQHTIGEATNITTVRCTVQSIVDTMTTQLVTHCSELPDIDAKPVGDQIYVLDHILDSYDVATRMLLDKKFTVTTGEFELFGWPKTTAFETNHESLRTAIIGKFGTVDKANALVDDFYKPGQNK